jgi:hypothetical protein
MVSERKEQIGLEMVRVLLIDIKLFRHNWQ